MLKGLALTPPVVGRISIGKVVEKNGKRLPEKDDEFTITSQVQNREGWVLHPMDVALRRAATGSSAAGTTTTESPSGSGKLRQIPIRLLFNDPDLNLRANYSLFDRDTGRQLCVGNGETCKRSTVSGVQTLACPSPAGCEMAAGGRCKPYGRLHVRLGDDDELGTFVFRTTGFNSIRTLATRLSYFHAVSGGALATLPLELRLRGKSTTQSHRAPIYYVDLTVRSGSTMAQALNEARAVAAERQAIGFDQAALEATASAGFALGAFEETEDDGVSVVEEFYPEGDDQEPAAVERLDRPTARRSLADRLEERTRQGAHASA